MGAMSDLHLLAMEVLEGDVSIEEQAENSYYDKNEIEWAVDEMKHGAV